MLDCTIIVVNSLDLLRFTNTAPVLIDQSTGKQIHYVSNFHDLVSTPFHGEMNAVCWKRTLTGDFSEIVDKITPSDAITILEEDELLALDLSEQGQCARETLLNDLRLLEAHGASPMLNVIQHYDRDEDNPIFPTDVYSFHVDRSPVIADTFLATYYGNPSEILPNSQSKQKILVPEIRAQLKALHNGQDEDFEAFLAAHFYDLHYDALPGASPINLGHGHLWRLAVDHPGLQSLPCVHRAPFESTGKRLLLIC
jgi:hypothetical protein